MCFFLLWFTPNKGERGAGKEAFPPRSPLGVPLVQLIHDLGLTLLPGEGDEVTEGGCPSSTLHSSAAQGSQICLLLVSTEEKSLQPILWMCKVNSNRKYRLSQLQLSRRSRPNDVVAIIIMSHLRFARRVSNDHLQHQQENVFIKIKLTCDLETSNFTYFICKLFPEDFVDFFIKSFSFIENQFSVI